MATLKQKARILFPTIDEVKILLELEKYSDQDIDDSCGETKECQKNEILAV